MNSSAPIVDLRNYIRFPKRVKICDLPKDCTERELEEIFKDNKQSSPPRANIVSTRYGSTNYGFVEFDTVEACNAALQGSFFLRGVPLSLQAALKRKRGMRPRLRSIGPTWLPAVPAYSAQMAPLMLPIPSQEGVFDNLQSTPGGQSSSTQSSQTFSHGQVLPGSMINQPQDFVTSSGCVRDEQAQTYGPTEDACRLPPPPHERPESQYSDYHANQPTSLGYNQQLPHGYGTYLPQATECVGYGTAQCQRLSTAPYYPVPPQQYIGSQGYGFLPAGYVAIQSHGCGNATNQPHVYGYLTNQPQHYEFATNQPQHYEFATNQPQHYEFATNQPQQYGYATHQPQQYGYATIQPQPHGYTTHELQLLPNCNPLPNHGLVEFSQQQTCVDDANPQENYVYDISQQGNNAHVTSQQQNYANGSDQHLNEEAHDPNQALYPGYIADQSPNRQQNQENSTEHQRNADATDAGDLNRISQNVNQSTANQSLYQATTSNLQLNHTDVTSSAYYGTEPMPTTVS